MRDSMVFYRSFYEAITELPEKDQLDAFHAIMEYSLNDIEIEISGVTKAVFALTKPQIDANNHRFENGKKGGRKKNKPEPNENQTETKPKPNRNQTETKPEPNVNENVNVNVNVEKNVEKKSAFAPPTEENVIVYCQEQGYTHVNAARFVDFYSSKGWMVGKNKMKDWKAAVRNWERQNKSESSGRPPSKNRFNNFDQRDYSGQDLEALLINSKPPDGR